MPSPTHIPVGATGLEPAATLTRTMLSLRGMCDPVRLVCTNRAYLGLGSGSLTCRPNSGVREPDERARWPLTFAWRATPGLACGGRPLSPTASEQGSVG